MAYISVFSNRGRTPSFRLVKWHERCLWPTIERLKVLKLIDRNGKLSAHTHVATSDADAVKYIVDDVPENDIAAPKSA